MENSEENNLKNIFKNLLVILLIAFITFYGISFISGAPDLVNKFLIYFGLFVVIIEIIALLIWQISKFFKS